LYPDFAPWRRALAERDVATSEALAGYLLERWGIATLPGTAFGEEAGDLRLRLATSMLYAAGGKREGRDEALWELLQRADELPEDDPGSGEPLPLPELERVEARFAEVVKELGPSEASAASAASETAEAPEAE
jgi:hypothetical protein